MSKQSKPHQKSHHHGRLKIRPPYYQNRNQQFEQIRKRMKMKTDGPTVNEISNIDTTGDLEQDYSRKEPQRRPVSTANQVKGWFSDNAKEIVIGIFITIIGGVLLEVVISHSNHLVKHDTNIEVLQNTDCKHDDKLEKLNEKTNEINTDIRLLEQRIELTTDIPSLPPSSRSH